MQVGEWGRVLYRGSRVEMLEPPGLRERVAEEYRGAAEVNEV